MSLDVFKAVIRGYSDHLFDLQIMAVYQGYWSGYYTRSKKPKNLDNVLKKLFKAKTKKTQKKPQNNSPQHDIDDEIETFLQRERLRLSKLNNK